VTPRIPGEPPKGMNIFCRYKDEDRWGVILQHRFVCGRDPDDGPDVVDHKEIEEVEGENTQYPAHEKLRDALWIFLRVEQDSGNEKSREHEKKVDPHTSLR